MTVLKILLVLFFVKGSFPSIKAVERASCSVKENKRGELEATVQRLRVHSK